jgi:hypothetical protein
MKQGRMSKRLLPLLALLFLAMCGGSESHTGATHDATGTAAPAADSGVAAIEAADPGAPVALSEADLDLYARGIVQETALVKAARERGAKATTPAERGLAAQAEWEDQTIPAAARAAGIDEARYRHVRNAVHGVFETLDFQGKIDGPLEMDIERASDDAKARLAKDPFDALTPSGAAALRARMDRLVPLWIDYTKLVALHG